MQNLESAKRLNKEYSPFTMNNLNNKRKKASTLILKDDDLQ